jgi:hypothetical protein
VLSVASAISKAVTAQPISFFPVAPGLANPPDQIAFSRSQIWVNIVHALKNIFAHYNEEECRREAAHQNASQSLHWPE